MRLGIVAVVVMASACGFIGPAANTGTDAPGDDAPPAQLTVGFAAPSSITDEAAGAHKVSVVLSGAPASPVTVNYRVLDGGTATPNVDFVLVAGTLTFPVDANQQDISMEILMDNLDEPDEAFTIVLEGPAGAALGLAMHHVTISANTVPRVGFAGTAMMLSETVTAPGISVHLDKMSTVPIQVDYKVVTAGTTATGGGVDFTLADGTLTIPAATLGATLPLAIVNDALDEDDETIAIVLSNPTNAELDPAATQLTYTILDEDAPPTVQFAAATTSVSEAAGGTGANVTLSGPSGKTITVPYTVTLGTASALDVAVADGTLTFAPGDTTKPIPFAIIQDALDEDDETFTLQLGAPTNATIGAIGTDLVTIVDDDAAPTISITTANGSVPESVGLVTLTVQLSAVSAKPITVDFAATGTATEIADFAYALSPHTLAFPAGSLAQTIAFTVVEDTLDEPDETVITTLANATNATIAGTPQTTTIVDDDPTCFGPAGSYQICIQTVPTTPVTLAAGTLNTDTAANGGSPLCATTAPMGWTMNQPDACFVMGTTITIPTGTTVKATGPRPLVLLATDTLSIAGTLDVSSHIGASSGPASNVGCASFGPAPVSGSGGGGGAGGGFMSIGGAGGTGNGGASAGGSALGPSAPPAALRGGCDGQHGGGGGGVNNAGSVGHGGGAVYLLAGNLLDLTNGTIDASGSGGTGGDNFTGGSGAGAGGMIELSATTYTKNATTRLFANGGGGAGGADSNSSGGSGADPTAPAITTVANGGMGGGGGNGGKGFAGLTQATVGAPGGGNKGGGGGGGGGGFIQAKVVSITGTTLSAGSVDSP